MTAHALPVAARRCDLVPADLVEMQARARADDALQTIGLMLSAAEAQLAALGDVRRNGGLRFTAMRRAQLIAGARALADSLEALS